MLQGITGWSLSLALTPGHINFRDLSKNYKKKVVWGLQYKQTVKTMVCGGCEKGKQTKAQHKKTADILTSRPLELLHKDLMGPTQTFGGKKYIMFIVDDYSRYAWAILLRDKIWIF